MSNAPTFVKYVSSVEGRMVPRFGTGTNTRAAELLGARRVMLKKEQRRAGEATVVWDTDRVIPFTEDYYLRFKREIDRAIKAGDLVTRTAEDVAAYLKTQDASRKAREDAALKAAEKARKAGPRAKKDPTGSEPEDEAGGHRTTHSEG